MIHFDLI